MKSLWTVAMAIVVSFDSCLCGGFKQSDCPSLGRQKDGYYAPLYVLGSGLVGLTWSKLLFPKQLNLEFDQKFIRFAIYNF